MRRPLEQLEQLRILRARREREQGIGGLIAQVRGGADRRHSRLGTLVTAWQTLLPADLADQTILTDLRGGVLYVTAASSSVSYQLDRRLRGGLEAELKRCSGSTLRRVRVRVGTLDEETSWDRRPRSQPGG